MATPGETTVLVTGISGFIGMHCARELLHRGYRVRGTLRSLAKEERVRGTLATHVNDVGDRLELAAADLSSDEGWPVATDGCQYVLHVASPLPKELPRHEDELIVPARDGALRLLRAAAASRVERVVLTSSVAAIAYGHPAPRPLTESDWTDVSRAPAYPKSKTLAERAAWDVMEELTPMELVVINPGLVLGPLMDSSFSTSGETIRKLLCREMPAIPNIGWAMVDVRDVADAHVEAMLCAEAAGERFICCATGHVTYRELADILHSHFGARGFRIPRTVVPDWIIRGVAAFDRGLGLAVGELGKREDVSNDHIKSTLGWKPRGLEEMAVAMAESMIEHGVVKTP